MNPCSSRKICGWKTLYRGLEISTSSGEFSTALNVNRVNSRKKKKLVSTFVSYGYMIQ